MSDILPHTGNTAVNKTDNLIQGEIQKRNTGYSTIAILLRGKGVWDISLLLS